MIIHHNLKKVKQIEEMEEKESETPTSSTEESSSAAIDRDELKGILFNNKHLINI